MNIRAESRVSLLVVIFLGILVTLPIVLLTIQVLVGDHE